MNLTFSQDGCCESDFTKSNSNKAVLLEISKRFEIIFHRNFAPQLLLVNINNGNGERFSNYDHSVSKTDPGTSLELLSQRDPS